MKRIFILVIGFLLITANLYAAGDLIVEGDVGIGTITPRATIDASDAVIFGGTYGSGWTEPNLGTGARLLWYPRKAAFRAGYAYLTSWDNANIGLFSFAIGYGTRAIGNYSTAFGDTVTVSGDQSFGSGYQIIVSGSKSFGLGENVTVSGDGAFGIGSSSYSPTTASGNGSFAGGAYVNPSDFAYGITASGAGSFAWGVVYDYESILASGIASIAIGKTVSATQDFAIALGRDFTNNTTNSFMVGFGQEDFRVESGKGYFSGNVGIGTTAPNTKVDIDGDVALRAGAFTATNGNNNNITIGGRSFIRITGPAAAFSITGIAGGVDGKVVILYNATAQNMTIANESTSSTDINRITTLTGSGIVTTGAGAITLIYDSTASRWIVTSARL